MTTSEILKCLLLSSVLLVFISEPGLTAIITKFFTGKNCGVSTPIRSFNFLHLPSTHLATKDLSKITCAWVTMFYWQQYDYLPRRCALAPKIITGESYSSQFSANNLIVGSCDWRNDTTNSSNYWLAPESTAPAEFVMDLTCQRLVEKIVVVNTHNDNYTDSGTKDFSVYISSNMSDWSILIANQSLSEYVVPTCPLTKMVYNVKGIGRYVKFVAETFYGLGAGLQLFRVI